MILKYVFTNIQNRKLSESEHHAILFASLDYPFE